MSLFYKGDLTSFLLSQEIVKDVPTLSSSEYGHRPDYDKPERNHVRIGHVLSEFYRRNGVMQCNSTWKECLNEVCM